MTFHDFCHFYFKAKLPIKSLFYNHNNRTQYSTAVDGKTVAWGGPGWKTLFTDVSTDKQTQHHPDS